MNKLSLTLGLFVIILSFWVCATDTLVIEKSVKSPNSGVGPVSVDAGGTYELNLIDCISDKTILYVNNNGPIKLVVGDTYHLNEDYYIRVDNLIPRTCDSRFCSDWYCSINISVFSRIGVCGNGVCDENENCKKDDCCSGEVVNFDSDVNNCGSCGHKCSERELCLHDNCIKKCGDGFCGEEEESICSQDCSWCGDGNCSGNETTQNCPEDCKKPIVCGDNVCDEDENCCSDCGCKPNYYCLNNLCVPSLDSKKQLPTTQEDNPRESPAGGAEEVKIQDSTAVSSDEQPVVKEVIVQGNGFFKNLFNWFKGLFGG